jgi:hypothetical protein
MAAHVNLVCAPVAPLPASMCHDDTLLMLGTLTWSRSVHASHVQAPSLAPHVLRAALLTAGLGLLLQRCHLVAPRFCRCAYCSASRATPCLGSCNIMNDATGKGALHGSRQCRGVDQKDRMSHILWCKACGVMNSCRICCQQQWHVADDPRSTAQVLHLRRRAKPHQSNSPAPIFSGASASAGAAAVG